MPVLEHLHKAQAFLQDAQLCVDHGRYDSAASRVYYAMFRAAIALLEHYGDVRPGWNHGRLEQALRREMVRERGLVHDGDVRELRSVYALRILADYRDRHISSQEAQTSLDAASRFVAKIEGVIRGAAHP
jgi:uncharacterized protein (UPF0332 family)